MAIRLLVFDVDGTLTEHHTPLSASTRNILDRLKERYRLLFLSAGSCQRILKQTDYYPVDVLGNYGMECALAKEDGHLYEAWHSVPVDGDKLLTAAAVLRKKFGYTDFQGNSLIINPNGCIIFPLLGDEAPLERRLSFDRDASIRERMYDEVVELFPSHLVFLGGTTSFDMPPKPFDKRFALCEYCSRMGFSTDEVVVFGDGYRKNENDEPLYLSEFTFVKVDDYRRIETAVSPYL